VDIKVDNKIKVIGHKNPDTDSICSVLAYTNLKNKLGGGEYEACRAGEISEETQYVLDRFKVEAPKPCYNVSSKVEDLDVADVPGIPPMASLREAWNAMRDSGFTTQPVTDDNGNLAGVVTLNDLSKGNMDALDAYVLSREKTPVKNIAAVLEGEFVTGNPDEILTRGKVLVGAGTPEAFENTLLEGDIVMVANRVDAQVAALNMGVKVLIVCLGAEVSKSVAELGEAKDCVIIKTKYDTYAAARLIIQAVPVKNLMTPAEQVRSFNPDTLLTEVKETMDETRHIHFPVLDNDGKYIGLISRRNLDVKNCDKLILVDHQETTQCVDGIADAQIMEVVDHHKIGDIQTNDPIYFRCEPVGCSATIVTSLYEENGVEIDPTTAGLLLSALLSDTLLFRSPTCTDRDVETGKKLAKIAGVDPEELAEHMFEAGENLEGKTAEDICYQDFKLFEHGGVRFGVGQASFMSEANMKKAEDMLLEYLPKTLEKDGTSMVFFMLTSVKDQGSRMLYAGADAEKTLEAGFDAKASDDSEPGILLPGVVSRKKQLIPNILGVLDK
jgi:manganese-dependent inorganic pyrophosphatase